MNDNKKQLQDFLKSGKTVNANSRGINRARLVYLRKKASNTYHEKKRKDGTIKRYPYTMLEYFIENKDKCKKEAKEL